MTDREINLLFLLSHLAMSEFESYTGGDEMNLVSMYSTFSLNCAQNFQTKMNQGIASIFIYAVPLHTFQLYFALLDSPTLDISSLDIGTYIIVTIMTFWTTSHCKKWLYPHLPLLQESITFDRRTCSIFINSHKMTIASDVLVGPWILWSCAMALMVLKLTN